MTTTPTLSAVEDLPPKPKGRDRAIWALSALVIVALLLYLAPIVARAKRPVGARHPAVGIVIPGIWLTPCHDADSELTVDDLNGKVTLINFWGTWCPPCREEFPHLMKLRSERTSHGDFRFVSVASSPTGHDDPNEVGKDVAEFLRAQQVTMPVYCDVEARTRMPLARVLETEGFAYPTSVVVDRQGAMRGIWVGYMAGDEQDIARLVDSVLAEK